MTAALDLDAIKARVAAASPGPWEDGDVWVLAGVMDKPSKGRCAYCHLGEPAWAGKTDINGTVMKAHRHRMPQPYGVGRLIVTAEGLIADGFTSPDDQAFTRHAREDVPALVAEVERLRAGLAELVTDFGEIATTARMKDDPSWRTAQTAVISCRALLRESVR